MPHVRATLRFAFTKQIKDLPNPDFGLIEKILTVARDESVATGGRLFFVYLPDCSAVAYGRDAWRPRLLASVKELNIPIIDADATIKDMQRNGPVPYYNCPGGHFSDAGAKAVADEIMRVIR